MESEMKNDSTAVADHADKTESANATDVSAAKPSEASEHIKTDVRNAAEYVAIIERSWKKGSDGEREMADACAQAQDTLDKGQLKQLHKEM
jgi:hypothetical protein